MMMTMCCYPHLRFLYYFLALVAFPTSRFCLVKAGGSRNDTASSSSSVSDLEMIRGRWSNERQKFDESNDIATILHMHAIDDYMTTTIYGQTERHFYAPIQDKCVLKHPLCTYLATRGECDVYQAKKFMLKECAPACFRCDELSYETRCNFNKSAADETNAWSTSGDLSKMFERIVNDSWFVQQYDVQIISKPPEGPWIVSFENLLTPRESNELIGVSEVFGGGWQRSWDAGKVGQDGQTARKVHSGRTSQTNWCTQACHNNVLTQDIHRRIENVTQIQQINYEHFQMLKYGTGDFYNLHHDYNPTHAERPQGVRLLTFFLYLNDVKSGGGTRFPDVIDPRTGKPGYVSMAKAGKAVSPYSSGILFCCFIRSYQHILSFALILSATMAVRI